MNSQIAADFPVPSFETVYAFIRERYKHDRFEGRNGPVNGENYSRGIVDSYLETLRSTGYSCVSHYESKTGEAIYFDHQLDALEGERLQCAFIGALGAFDRGEILASHAKVNYGQLTTEMGTTVSGFLVEIDGKPAVRAWSIEQSANYFELTQRIVMGALRTAGDIAAFIALLQTKSEEISFETLQATPDKPKPLTVTLRDGTVVLAKSYKGEPMALTYANRTQANNAAQRFGGVVIGPRPFYVRVSSPSN